MPSNNTMGAVLIIGSCVIVVMAIVERRLGYQKAFIEGLALAFAMLVFGVFLRR